MTPKPERRLHLGCGETLDPLVPVARRSRPGLTPAGQVRAGTMPRLPIGVLRKR